MIFPIESHVTTERQLTAEEIKRLEEYATTFFGGRERCYAEVIPIEETDWQYRILIDRR